MLRYLSYVLLAALMATLLVAVGAVLLSEMADRLSDERAIRLVAFDAVVPQGESRVTARFALQDAGRNRPMAMPFLFVRFPDERTEAGWMNPTQGIGAAEHVGAMPAGLSSYEVHFNDTDDRMAVRSRGAVWAEPPGLTALWVDAATLLRPAHPTDVAGATAFPSAREAADAMKRLAEGRRVVYLVTDGPREYGVLRQQLAAAGYPPGPVLWIQPGREVEFLKAAARSWRQVTAALVCRPVLATAMKALKVRTYMLPSAEGAPAGAATPPSAWSEVVEMLGPK